jgi:proteasome assembly chaperone (PAC2) family protein
MVLSKQLNLENELEAIKTEKAKADEVIANMKEFLEAEKSDRDNWVEKFE